MQEEVKHYKVKSLPTTLRPNSVYYVKATSQSAVKTYITDQNGFPFPLIDLASLSLLGIVNSVSGTGVTGTSSNPTVNISTFKSSQLGNLIEVSTVDGKLFVKPITSPDGSIDVVSTSSALELQIGASLQDQINNAIQPGDNVSDLVNDAGYLTEFTEEDPVFSAWLMSDPLSDIIDTLNTKVEEAPIDGLQYIRQDGDWVELDIPVVETPNLQEVTDQGNTTTNKVIITNEGLETSYTQFDVAATETNAVGKLKWNDVDGTLDLGLKGGNVNLQIGQEQVALVVNKTDNDLLEAEYNVVKVTGAQGQRLAVGLAKADSDLNSAATLGIVTENIAKNQEGFITTSGQIREINTTGSLQGETWNDGDVLYLSATIDGAITNIKPISPYHLVILGYVEYAHSQHGKIFVKVDNGYELDELHNVNIDTPLDNQGLVYNSTDSLWENKTIIQDAIVDGVTEIAPSQNAVFDALATKQDTLTNPITGTGATGQVSFFDGTNSQTGDNGLFWDNTNKRLEIFNSSVGYGVAPLIVRNNVPYQSPYTQYIQVWQNPDGGVLASVRADGRIFSSNDINSNYFVTNITGTTNAPVFRLGSNGLFFPNSSNLGFVTNSTERLRITDAGNVGIGTTVPTAKLQVNQTTTDIGAVIGNTTHNSQLQIYTAAAGKNSEIWFGDAVDGDVGKIDYDHNDNSLSFTTNAVEAMRINSIGNIGIGTTAPSQKLDVVGKIALNDGGNSVYIGTDAGLNDDASDNRNVGVGHQSLLSNTTGFNNTANGSYSLYANTTGGNNTANGHQSLLSNTTGFNNTANGSYSLYANTTGGNNTANGYFSLRLNTTGFNNTANGSYSLYANTTGGNNTANGHQSLLSNTTGFNNTANGSYSLYANTTGGNNTANGYFSLRLNTTGFNNTSNGVNSLRSNTTGAGNTAIGLDSGRYISDGTTANTITNNSVYLGYNTKALADNQTNQIVIGYAATGLGSNTAVLGNDSIVTTALKGNVGIGTTSPTFKLNVKSSTGDDGISLSATTGRKGVELLLDSGVNGGGDIKMYTGNSVLTNRINAQGSSYINGGNVGIGTTNPQAKLHVYGGNIKIEEGTGGDEQIEVSGGYLAKYNGLDNAWGFAQGRIYINGDTENIGIGTTSPNAKLDVNGDILIKAANLSNQENLDVDTGTEVVATVAIATYTAAFFDFVIKNGTNVRSGTVYACHDGTNVEFTETSTTDLGNTTPVTLSVDISGTDMRLLATTTTDNWIVKSLVRAL